MNFETDKIIIFHYEMGAGGRFLMNCLSLSDDCVFTNSKLAELQLTNKLDQTKKIKYLLYSIDNTKEKWTDLNLYDKDWTGLDPDIHFHLTPEQMKEFKYDYVFEYLTEKNTKYMFLNTHSESELNKLLLVWNNAKVISFDNSKLFNLIRKHETVYNRFVIIWNKLADDGWPDPPYSMIQYENMPKEIKNKVNEKLKDVDFILELKREMEKTKVNCEIKKFKEYKELSQKDKDILKQKYKNNDYVYENSFFVWDVNWYLDYEELKNNIQRLYKILNLGNYNETMIKLYYDKWIEKLDELRTI